jgi:inosine-uridine nucleoside N-ribohydrolase
MAVALATPLIIDTDPTAFSDDNAALVMCFRGGANVSGVTTVSGNCWAQDGLRHARKTVQLLGRRVPVHMGAIDPRKHTALKAKQQGPVEFYGAFGTPRPRSRKSTAFDFLVQKLEASEGVDILAIGPLTNIAMLVEKRPDLAARIRRLIIMGGNVYVPGNATRSAEFNFWFDPEAAAIVLRSSIPHKLLFGLDICNQVVVGRDVFDRIVQRRTPVTRLYEASFGHDFPGFYRKPDAKAYLWDELAAAYVLDPAVVKKSEKRYLDVVTDFGPEYGKVIVHDRMEGSTKVEIMLEADAQRALDLYVSLLGE